MLRRVDGKYMLAQERRLQARLNTLLKVQMKYCVEILTDLPSLREAGIQKNSASDNNYLDEKLRSLPAVGRIAETIVAIAKPTLNKGGQKSVKELELGKFGISFSLKHPDAVDYLNTKQRLLLSDYKGTITYTTKNNIKRIVTKGLEEGKAYTELAKDIKMQGEAGVFSRARAELIASHELGEAYNAGQKIPVDELIGKYPGIKVEKIWLTVGDDAVTPECEANGDEGWIDYNSDFSSGDPYPPRTDHPRCRCSWSQRIE